MHILSVIDSAPPVRYGHISRELDRIQILHGGGEIRYRMAGVTELGKALKHNSGQDW